MEEKKDLTKFTIAMKDLLVFLPFLHVFICSLFLLGYAYAFGSGVVNFVSIADLFSLSLRHISFLYLQISGYVFGALYMRIKVGAWSRGEAIEKILEPSEKSIATVDWYGRIKKYKKEEILFICAIFLGLATRYLFEGRITYVAVGIIAALVLTNCVIFTCNKLDISGANSLLVSGLAWSFVVSLFTGMAIGDSDRYKSIDDLSKEYASCNDFTIIRPMSPNFLAIDKKNRHAIIDVKCSPLFWLNYPSSIFVPIDEITRRLGN